MEHTHINAIPGLTAYRLSHLVSRLPLFAKPDRRGRLRKMGSKAALLRAMADRYPNVWASAEDYAAKAHCSERQAQEMLRELEFEDRLVVDITPGPGRYHGHRMAHRIPGAGATIGGKKLGGVGQTVQYFIRDRKIVDIFMQWALNTPSGEPNSPKDEDRNEARRLMADLERARPKGEPGEHERVSPEVANGEPVGIQTVSPEKQTVSPETSNGAPCAPEPVSRTGHPEPERREPVSENQPSNQPPETVGGRAGWMRLAFARAKDGQMLKMKSSEIAALPGLVEEHSELDVRAAWLGFIGGANEGRDTEGLHWPVTAFIKEFSAALEAYGNIDWLRRCWQADVEGSRALPSSYYDELKLLGFDWHE